MKLRTDRIGAAKAAGTLAAEPFTPTALPAKAEMGKEATAGLNDRRRTTERRIDFTVRRFYRTDAHRTMSL